VKLFSGTPLSQFADAPLRPAAPSANEPRRPAKLGTPEDIAARARAARSAAALARAASMPAPLPEQRVARPHHERPAIPASPPAQLRLMPIPRLATGGRWRVEAMRSLSEPILLWFTRGQGRITVGGVTRGYGVHNAVYIPAGVMHGFEVGQQTYGTAVFFGHNCTVSLPTEALHLRIRDAGPQGELNLILDNIQRELEGARPGAERAAQMYLGLLGVWLERQREGGQSEGPRKGASQKLAERYSEMLERDFATGKGVADFARDLGVTPTHLSRVCNQSCGRSASDLLHDRVIFEARRLLTETRMPVGDISRALGFTSAAYFTRAFQHRTGKTPSSFRKQP
jgi:AraC-like DNA-binding protein